MPFEAKKKQLKHEGPPTHAQEVALSSIESAFVDLVQVLTYVSRNDPEMRKIIAALRDPVIAAKRWVLEQ